MLARDWTRPFLNCFCIEKLDIFLKMFFFTNVVIEERASSVSQANALSEPPGEYERKLKTQRN